MKKIAFGIMLFFGGLMSFLTFIALWVIRQSTVFNLARGLSIKDFLQANNLMLLFVLSIIIMIIGFGITVIETFIKDDKKWFV